MGLELDYIDGQTPLEEEEKEGLLIKTLTTRNELDEFEQNNIEEAMLWVLTRNFKKEEVLTEKFVCMVHKKMYGSIWSWAGKFRKTNKNIGIDKWQISTSLKSLLADVDYWINHEVYTSDEIAIRFKHRLVSIHCFPNGNGRHSRLIADILIEKILKQEVFTWGAKNLVKQSDTRLEYLSALREADHNNISPLLSFARS